MKNLENYGLVELNAIEMISIDGGFISTCNYGIPVPKPNVVSFQDF